MSIDVSTTICHEEVPAVTTLEQQLGKQVDSDPSGPNSAPVVPISPSMFNDIHQTMSIDVSTTTCHEKVLVTSEPAMSSLWTDEDLAYDSLEQFSSSPILFGTNLENISALVAADLVHVFAPMIQKTRYFTWAYQENPSPERTCLRLAMRSLAAAVSTQLRNLADSLYAQTRQMLNALDSIRLKLEQVQAWILVSYFEALFHSRTQTLLTAGRAMRLVQVLRLNLGDTPEAQSPEKSLVDAPWMQEEMLMVAEERRRTYWVAYCLDRLLCLAPNMTLTLQEDMSYLRLPNSESNFENGQLNLMGFLPEIPTRGEHEPSPALAECIFMSTLYGRCMFHRCIALSDCMSGKVHYDFWKRQEELSQDVEKQMKLLQRAGAPSIMERRDPLLAFSLILGHSLVVYHCETAKLQTYQTVEQHIVTINCVTRAHQSAKSIVEWAREFGPSRCLKAHPFLSSAISIVVRFLISSSREPSEPTEDYKDDIQTLLSVLRSLSGIYRCASQLLDELESEEMFLGMSMDYTSLSAC
ncbi:putative Oleate activated transcription factor 3 [Seiridium unicorne]|uniref:Oleate activated transcription factor 3 n=1 Tax=Seiridium unicorne TaxID=138068 RepID=A0ABR2UF17_9PEZI